MKSKIKTEPQKPLITMAQLDRFNAANLKAAPRLTLSNPWRAEPSIDSELHGFYRVRNNNRCIASALLPDDARDIAASLNACAGIEPGAVPGALKLIRAIAGEFPADSSARKPWRDMDRTDLIEFLEGFSKEARNINAEAEPPKCPYCRDPHPRTPFEECRANRNWRAADAAARAKA